MRFTANEINFALKAATASIEEYSSRNGLFSLFEDLPSWGIVGGCVRDAVYSSLVHDETLAPIWTDVDVMVAATNSSLGDLFAKDKKYSSLKITRTSFGGFRLALDRLGTIDVWGNQSLEATSLQIPWNRALAVNDFGVNSAVFVANQRCIVNTQQFIDDISHNRVELIAGLSLSQYMLPCRAVAVSERLRFFLGRRGSLGPNIRFLIRQLAEDWSEQEAFRCFSYLTEKIASGSWPISVARAFARMLVRFKDPSIHIPEALNALDDWMLRDYQLAVSHRAHRTFYQVVADIRN